MATSDGFRALLARATREIPPATWQEPADLVRYSQESLVADEHGDARVLRSAGSLRLHGDGVDEHSVDLDEVGKISVLWQKSVTSMGAALEDIRSARGPLPAGIVRKTRLQLTSSPGPGSVVLRIAPRADPLAETEPEGARPLVGGKRPLADRASETLLSLFQEVAGADASSVDGISLRLRELGPRVASSLQALATALTNADIALDATWREPGAPTRRAAWSTSDARWIRDFIEGRELDAAVETFTGVAATVSNRERWLIETEEGAEKVVASALGLEDVRRVRSGDTVSLRVRTTTKTQPDGTTRTRREAIALLDVQPPGTALTGGDPDSEA